jgi:transcriptional regulator with XRE-family HTH domain
MTPLVQWYSRVESHQSRTGTPALPFCHVHLRTQRPLSRAYPNALKTLGDHIRKRTLDLQLLQSDVAQTLGVTECSVWNWENNATAPVFPYWPGIIEFLGYNPLPEPQTPAEQLVQARKIQGLSQKEMANRLGVDPSTLARRERREREPTGMFLSRVHCFLVDEEEAGRSDSRRAG